MQKTRVKRDTRVNAAARKEGKIMKQIWRVVMVMMVLVAVVGGRPVTETDPQQQQLTGRATYYWTAECTNLLHCLLHWRSYCTARQPNELQELEPFELHRNLLSCRVHYTVPTPPLHYIGVQTSHAAAAAATRILRTPLQCSWSPAWLLHFALAWLHPAVG